MRLAPARNALIGEEMRCDGFASNKKSLLIGFTLISLTASQSQQPRYRDLPLQLPDVMNPPGPSMGPGGPFKPNYPPRGGPMMQGVPPGQPGGPFPFPAGGPPGMPPHPNTLSQNAQTLPHLLPHQD